METVQHSDPAPTDDRGHPFPIVGIGASAGGMEAFTELLHRLPERCGMAFVLIQHLDPRHTSSLPDALRRASSLPVDEIKDGTVVEPDHVNVIPSDCDVGILHGVLALLPRPPGKQPHLAIDFFFQALARDRGASAIGIVLSGTGSDGTAGLTTILAEGGITFAQDPATARFAGMPEAAIKAGVVDVVRPIPELVDELLRIGQAPLTRVPRRAVVAAHRRGRAQEDPRRAAQRRRRRLQRVQGHDDQAPARAADDVATDDLARRLPAAAACRAWRGTQAVRRRADPRDVVLSRPRGLRSAPDRRVSRDRTGQARRADPDLGRRLQHGRGGLFDRDHRARVPRAAPRRAGRCARPAVRHGRQREGDRAGAGRHLSRLDRPRRERRTAPHVLHQGRRRLLDVVHRFETMLLDRYAPAGVIVNERMEILHFRGRTGLYLEPAPGQPQHNLLHMLREGLLADIRIAIAQARRDATTIRKTGVQVVHDGQTTPCSIVVIPLAIPPATRQYLFGVLFEEVQAPA